MPAPSEVLWESGKPLTPQETTHPCSVSGKSCSPKALQAQPCLPEGASTAPAAGGPAPVARLSHTAQWHAPSRQKRPSPAADAPTTNCPATAMRVNGFGAEGVFL